MKFSKISIICFIGLVCGVPTIALSDLVNGGFETGNFQGWSTLGTVSVETEGSFGIPPTDGTYQAFIENHYPGDKGVPVGQLESFLNTNPGGLSSLGNGEATQGSAIQQTFSGSAGDVLTFDWNFLTNDDPNDNINNDFAFAIISNSNIYTIANTFDLFSGDSTSLFGNATGYNTFSYTLPSSGIYTLGIGVVDVHNKFVESALLIDKVSLKSIPEPTSMIPLGTGVLALACYSGYRRSRAR